MRFQFDEEKAIATILHIVHEVRARGEDKIGLHKVFKILYFADREHLATWGRPITGDIFVAMNYGPVPSNIYDMLKSTKGDCRFISKETYSPLFEISGGHWVVAKQTPDLDVLPESCLEALNKAIDENAHLDFKELVDKSHDRAWDTATKDGNMSYKRMAQVAGANAEMITYIRHNAYNSTFFA